MVDEISTREGIGGRRGFQMGIQDWRKEEGAIAVNEMVGVLSKERVGVG